VISSLSAYGPTIQLLSNIFGKFGVQTDFVDTSQPDQIRRAIKPNTKVIYIETPGNPTLVLTDIQMISDLAHSIGAQVVIDNTFMSPLLQKPFLLGADIVLHSMTKFLNGHADVVAGVIIVKTQQQAVLFRKILTHTGAIMDPFNAFLVHRGLKTLNLRMTQQSQNALQVAQFLEGHPQVSWVRYPGLKSFPQYELAQKQMQGPGAMIVCELAGGLSAGKQLMNSVQLFQLAVSLGGIESLIQHPASMTHASLSSEQRNQAQITNGLIRLSIGIESAEDLINDLKQSLENPL